ncbi:MAG: amidohydrolase family protein [Desulfobacterales bacterium]|jgi:predicted TIM-barrel fold metal-dependent hydrolase
MIIDFHTHIFPPETRQNRTTCFTSEEAFYRLYSDPQACMIGARALIENMDRQGVDRSVVFGFPWESAERFRRQNDYIMEAVAAHPDRLVGLACFDANHPTAAEEARRCLAGGLSGVGELAYYEAGLTEDNLDRLAPVMEICREKEAIVLIHTNEPVGHRYPGKSPNTLSQIYRLAQRFPGNRLVLAHWGGGLFFYALLKKEVRETLRNVYFDTAASPFLYEASIWETAVRIIGAEKILLGTDYPLLEPSRYLREIEASALSDEDKTRIKGGNAAALLDLSIK